MPRDGTGCTTGPVGRSRSRRARRRTWRPESSRHAAELRAGRDRIAEVTGVPARTVSRILTRHRAARDRGPGPGHRSRDPGLEGDEPPLRAGRTRRPGPRGRQEARAYPRRRRLAHPRTAARAGTAPAAVSGSTTSTPSSTTTPAWPTPRSRPTRRAAPRPAVLLRAAAFFASHGVTIREVISDNAFAYRRSTDFKDAIADLGRTTAVHQAALPLAERESRTIQPHPADRMGLPAALHQQRQRAAALDPWLHHYNNDRNHHGIGGKPPISRVQS